MLVNKQGSHFLKEITRPKNAINTTHACTHLGGRGCACAPAFFLYYYHPPHNFFCNIAPFMGRCLHMVIMGCKSYATHYGIPLCPPYSMASDRGYVFVVCKEVLLGFYVVTKQAMTLTRDKHTKPRHNTCKVIYL